MCDSVQFDFDDLEVIIFVERNANQRNGNVGDSVASSETVERSK